MQRATIASTGDHRDSEIPSAPKRGTNQRFSVSLTGPAGTAQQGTASGPIGEWDWQGRLFCVVADPRLRFLWYFYFTTLYFWSKTRTQLFAEMINRTLTKVSNLSGAWPRLSPSNRLPNDTAMWYVNLQLRYQILIKIRPAYTTCKKRTERFPRLESQQVK